MSGASDAELMLKLFDGDITHEEFELLQRRMREDESLKEMYLEHAALEHAMDHLVGERALPDRRSLLNKGGLARRAAVRWAGVAAAVILGIGAWVGWSFLSGVSDVRAEMRFSRNSVWQVDGVSTAARELRSGQSLSVEYGAVELGLPDGVVGIVEGPARLEVLEDGVVRMEEGRGSFVVPEEGRGFTVETGRMRVVDLGTAFTVVAGWHDQEEVHVTQGSVEVVTDDASRKLVEGEAVAVSAAGEVEETDCKPSYFLGRLPDAVRLVYADDFERVKCADGEVKGGRLPGWASIEGDGGGSFNPRGRGAFYRNPGLDDRGGSAGILSGMKGPNVGFIYSPKPVVLERKVGTLEGPGKYTLQISLGVRSNKSSRYGGYTLALVSNGKVLGTLSSNKAPGEKDAFSRVVLNVDVSELPEGVAYGDSLAVRIMSNAARAPARCYLDFDNLQLSFQARDAGIKK